MYDTKNKTKKELVLEICKELNSHGFQDINCRGEVEPYGQTSQFGTGLLHMPVENLRRMLDTPISDWSEFSKVYDAWGRSGALKFQPYSNHSEHPSLVLRHNRYLHIFRGYYFQVSDTLDGVFAEGSGSYSIEFLTGANQYDKLRSNSFIAYMLWWAAYIDVGFRFKNFEELFYDDVSALEDFLHESIAYCGKSFKYGWSDVSNCIKKDNTPIDIVKRKVYQIFDEKGIVARCAIGKETIQVETSECTLTLAIPDMFIGVDYCKDNEDEMDNLEDEIDILESYHFREILAVMLLKLVGVHISFVNWYTLSKKTKRLRPINRPGVVTVKNMNGMYNVEPDDY